MAGIVYPELVSRAGRDDLAGPGPGMMPKSAAMDSPVWPGRALAAISRSGPASGSGRAHAPGRHGDTGCSTGVTGSGTFTARRGRAVGSRRIGVSRPGRSGSWSRRTASRVRCGKRGPGVRVGGDDRRAECVSEEVKGVGVRVRGVSVPRRGVAHVWLGWRRC